LYTKIDQTLVNSLHGLLNCQIGGLDCRVITAEYRTRVHCLNIDQTLLNSFHRLLNCEIGGLDFRVITTEYRTRVHYIQTLTRHS